MKWVKICQLITCYCKLGPMVRHYALKPKASIRLYLLKRSLRELFGLLSTWICIQTHYLVSLRALTERPELSQRGQIVFGLSESSHREAE